MAQITLYVDDELAKAMRDAAEAAGVSLSRWIANLARERTASTWPAEFLALEGAWSEDGPEFEEPAGTDIPREPL